MKKLLTILLILLPLVCFGQTRPHAVDIRGKPYVDVREFGVTAGLLDTALTSAAAALPDGGTIFIPSPVKPEAQEKKDYQTIGRPLTRPRDDRREGRLPLVYRAAPLEGLAVILLQRRRGTA